MNANDDSPLVLVIGGPNGAGKSTCAEFVLRDVLTGLDFVNADTIARGLSRYRPETVAVEAGRLMLRRLQQLGERRQNFAFETTLSGRSHVKLLKGLVEQGYQFELFYVWLRSPDLAVKRVSDRVKQGGHEVPVQDIRRRYYRSVRNFFELYMPLATRWRVYDNTGEHRTLVARGGTSRPTQVLQEKTYHAFQDAAKHAE